MPPYAAQLIAAARATDAGGGDSADERASALSAATTRSASSLRSASSSSTRSVGSSTRRSFGSLVFRENDTPEIWKNKLDELALRVELERLQRLEAQTQLELHRRQKLADEARSFAQRSGPALSGLRADLGAIVGSQQRSSVDRIIFGRDIDGSEEVDGFQGEDWSMFGPRRGKTHSAKQLKCDVDVIVFGRDQDFSGDIPEEAEVSNVGRKVDQRQFRSDADMAIFGRDQDYSNGHESYSNRNQHA